MLSVAASSFSHLMVRQEKETHEDEVVENDTFLGLYASQWDLVGLFFAAIIFAPLWVPTSIVFFPVVVIPMAWAVIEFLFKFYTGFYD